MRFIQFVFLFLLIQSASCMMNNRDLSEHAEGKIGNLRSTRMRADSVQSGLYLQVTNSLAQDRSTLSVAVCRDVTGGREERHYCYFTERGHQIPYGETKSFYLSRDELADLQNSIGTDEISFRFNDTHSRSVSHWHCWDNIGNQVNWNGMNRFRIQVTQSNVTSYSCRVESF